MHRVTASNHGRGRARSSTDALLQKANSHLRGEKVGTSVRSEEDELGAYLSGLNRKPTELPQNIQWDRFGEDDLSDEVDDVAQSKSAARATATTGAGSKFLKKKKAPAPVQNENMHAEITSKSEAASLVPKPDARVVPIQSRTKSSALSKVASFTDRYERKPQRELALSESDMDLTISMDDEVLKDVQNLRPSTAVPASRKSLRTPSPDTSSEGGLGKGGSRFLKKPKRTLRVNEMKSVKDEGEDSTQPGADGSRFLKKKTTFADEQSSAKQSSAWAVAQMKPSLGSKNTQHLANVLDADDDSIAEHIPEIPLVDVTTPRSPMTPRGILKTPRTPRTPRTPTPMEDIREESEQSSSLECKDQEASDGESEESFKSISDNVGTDISEQHFTNVNFMDLDSLEPAIPIAASNVKTTSGKAKKEKAKAKQRKSAAEPADDLFASMGLHTVDELLTQKEPDSDREISEASDMGGGMTSEIKTEVEDYYYESDFDPVSARSQTPLRSILSPTPRSTPRSSRSRVRYNLEDEVKVRSRSPSPEVISTARRSHSQSSIVYTEDFEDESASEFGTATIRTEYESDSEDSDEDHAGYRSGQRRKDSDDYSDDFTSGTELTPRHPYTRSSSRESDVASFTESFTSYASYDSSSRSRTPSPDLKPPHVKTANAKIQTGLDLGDLVYHWNQSMGGVAAQGPSYGLTGVDPSPIATHVVGADALEALTSYSPSVIALNDMLKQQLQLTTQFLDSQRRLHKAMIEHLEPEFHYTTLEDTKKYIKKHKKKTLTFEEALKQVKNEMDLE